MPRLTARLLQEQVTGLRNRQFRVGPVSGLERRPLPSLGRDPILPDPKLVRLRRKSVAVQAENASASGLPSSGRAWKTQDSTNGWRSQRSPESLPSRCLRIGPVPRELLRHRKPAQSRKPANRRARARRRQQKFEDILRVSVGEEGILLRLSMGGSGADYKKRVDMLWAFMSKHGLESRRPCLLDEALSDYAGWAYLAGEKAERGETMKAALAALHPLLMPPGRLMHPLFDRAIREWWRAAPSFARVGCPEGVCCAFSGHLLRADRLSMALFNIASFSTYLRPSSGIVLRTLDLVAPPPAGGTAALQNWTLLAAPTERETATKTGDYDMAVALDDTRGPRLEQLLHRQSLV